MGTIASVYDNYKRVSGSLEDDLATLVQDNSDLVTDLVREQLDAGRDGYGQPLTPSYLDDPYFQDKIYKDPARAARNYMQWKAKITPPETTWRLMLPPRAEETPNLRINGYYHSTIQSAAIKGGVRVGSLNDSLGIGSDVTAKYGDDRLYTLGDEAKEYIKDNIIIPYLEKLFTA